jgi:cellulose synthase/poly-beta-1,6-N-acetylglucosamine synthase-like glycosyltransferase
MCGFAAKDQGGSSPVVAISLNGRRLLVHLALTSLFWVSLLGLFYAYAGYPLAVCFLAGLTQRMRGGHRRAAPGGAQPRQQQLPEITVVISAFNAENHIRERIENILECNYPRDRLSILVASDGSTDGTVAAVGRLENPNVRVIPFSVRRGKVATLVDAVGHVSSEVIVFTDASNRFDASSLRQLTRHFQEPEVGLVTGKAAMIDEQGNPSESLYWRSEMTVRRCEAKLGIMLGASGAIYAVRRELFVKPSRPIINDDLVLPMLVQLTHGCRFVFDDTARAFVTSAGGISCEFRRRCRIGSGAFQCLPVLGDLLRWRNGKQAFAFASHKLLRWLCPFLLVSLLASNLALMSIDGYDQFLWIQAIAYSTAFFGLFAPNRGLFARLARTACSFVFMNLALLFGFVRWSLDPQAVTWNPTQRPSWNQLQGAKNL